MLQWLVGILAFLCLLTSLLPMVPLPHGIFRVFDFPRIQSASISAGTIVIALLFLPWTSTTWIMIAALGAAFAIQLYHIARFSPFWPRRSANYKGEPPDAPLISILTSNVKQGNRRFDELQKLVTSCDADICVFMETDEQWIEALKEVTSQYRHHIEQPLSNGYGMYLVSRFPLASSEIRFLLNEEVPSFDLMVEHPQEGSFRLISVHPEPPVAYNNTIGRDAEIAMVGQMVRSEERPVIVCGDLNDVAWSMTTRRFVRIARLLDPREGRGQFNTFDARYFFLRWPLDHIFHSAHFKLVGMKRLPHIGSDHFPMIYTLALTEQEKGRREIDSASKEDMDEANDLIEEEKKRDHRPVGYNWEDAD